MSTEIPQEEQELSYFDKVNFCNQILRSDEKIRSVGMANINGSVDTLLYREGLTPLLSDGESTPALIQATVRLLSRKLHDSKIGKTIYSVTVHEYLSRISIPLGDDSALLISIDKNAIYDDIVFKKILPVLKKHNFDIVN